MATLDVLDIFRDWVEYSKGWDTIQGAESSKREKIVQRLIHLGSKNYISANDLDISFEPDAGRGSVDFKVSRGGDKTIVEIKLSTNTQYLHGYEEQVEEYGKAECTDKIIYVFIGPPNEYSTLGGTSGKTVLRMILRSSSSRSCSVSVLVVMLPRSRCSSLKRIVPLERCHNIFNFHFPLKIFIPSSTGHCSFTA